MKLRFKLRHLGQAYGVNGGDPYYSFHFRFQFVNAAWNSWLLREDVPAHIIDREVPPLSATSGLVDRSSKITPRDRSSSLICWLAADGVILLISAARDRLRVLAMSRKRRRFSRVTLDSVR